MPSHGPAEQPDVDALIETLDTFWRFLRGTGRMRSGSAEAKDLVREARRVAPRMRDACADPDRHSTSKALMRFADEAGLSLEGAASEDELNQRMQQVMEAFNNLPFEERDRWLPSPGAPGADTTPRMSDLLRQAFGDADAEEDPFADLDEFVEDAEDDGWDERDFDDETWALLPESEDLTDEPDRGVTAQEVQASPFVKQCFALAAWVGDGKQVTATGVLRLAPAREAYVALGLWDWEVQSYRWTHDPDPVLSSHVPSPDQEAVRDEMLAGLRSAADAFPLQRLWRACVFAGLIEVGKTKARATSEADPALTRSDDEWTSLGVAAVVTTLAIGAGWLPIDPLLRALLPFLGEGVERVTEGEVCDWWWSHPDNILSLLELEVESELRPVSDDTVRALLWRLDDTGVWRREGEILHRTSLGTELAMTATNLMDEGILTP